MRRDFIYIVLFLLIVNISIVLDMPFFRQILPFMFFTFIPGFLLLRILKIKTPLSQLTVFSVAMSVSFLYLTGLFVNTVFPVKPLSYPFLIVSNIIVLFLTAMLREEEIFNFQVNFDKTEIKLYIMGLILPFLVIVGSYVLNKFNNNLLIVFSIVYLLFYIIVALKAKNLSYAFVIWILAVSLLFMVSLRTDYLISGDTPVEYNLFKVSASAFKWNAGSIPYSLRPEYNTCLSITILPTLYYYMSNLNGFYIFKVFLIFIVSFVPVAIYRLNSIFLPEKKSFLNTLLFISYYQFIYSISNLRTLIAILYFVLIVLLIFDESMPKIRRSIISLIFALSLVFSHYSTTYITFLFLIIAFIVLILLKKYQGNQVYQNRVTAAFTIFLFVMLFLWYAMINFHTSSFDHFITFLQNTMISLTDAFRFDMYHESGQRIFGIGLKWPVEYINMLVYYITLSTISIGFLSEFVKRFKDNDSIFEDTYIVFMTISMAILAATIILPYISIGYGPERVLIFCLVTLTPCFSVGVGKIHEILRWMTRYRVNFDLNHVGILILFLFLFTNIGLIYQIFGDHHSMVFNNDGFQYETLALHKEEYYGSLWLNETKENLKFVTGDRYTSERLTCFGLHLERSSISFSNNSYLFLRKGVLDTGRFYNGDFDYENIDDLFKDIGKIDKIYDNGGSQILIKNVEESNGEN